MQPSLTDTLCTRCGLCCDGSLFADVELAGPAEVTRLQILGLQIDDDAEADLLVLPCGALRGTRCSIYAHRPSCCRTFECGLLLDARSGTIGVERAQRHIADALQRIAHVKQLMSRLGQRGRRLPLKERYADTLARRSTHPDANRIRSELETAMAGVERLIRKTFLGRARRT